MKLVRAGVFAVCMLVLAALASSGASAAAAESRTFLKLGSEAPSGDANATFGPATDYPSSIVVSGVPGTVTNVTATIIGLGSGSPDDIDMALVGPNEEQVMLMSDACGTSPISGRSWTFDDAVAVALSDNGPCNTLGPVASFRPSNFENAPPDDFSKEGGGPPPPYGDTLSDLAGGSPDGSWELFVLDDNSMVVGFGFEAWALTLEIEPPAPEVRTVTVTVPGPATTTTTKSSSGGAAGGSAKTGKRAAALAKCAKKKSKDHRAKCRAKARKLPV